jgi:hypothetical protein
VTLLTLLTVTARDDPRMLGPALGLAWLRGLIKVAMHNGELIN